MMVDTDDMYKVLYHIYKGGRLRGAQFNTGKLILEVKRKQENVGSVYMKKLMELCAAS